MKNEAPLSIKKWIIQNLFVLATVCVAIANLWLLNKLSPVFQDIAVHAQRITSLENDYSNINKKLDQLIFMHLEK